MKSKFLLSVIILLSVLVGISRAQMKLNGEITNADGKDSYPIAGFTWLLIYKNMKDKTKAEAIVNFLKWAVTDGEKYAKELYYAPLLKEAVKLDEEKIAQIVAK